MKLEPVYLVAPRPKPPSMPTRRAFFGMGLAFVCGGAIGSACGYSVGSERAVDAAADKPPVEEELPKSGDPKLDQLRWLAVKAPIDELVSKASNLLMEIPGRYALDEILWQGVDRLGRHLVDNPSVVRRRAISQFIIQMVGASTSPLAQARKPLVEELRALK